MKIEELGEALIVKLESGESSPEELLDMVKQLLGGSHEDLEKLLETVQRSVRAPLLKYLAAHAEILSGSELHRFLRREFNEDEGRIAALIIDTQHKIERIVAVEAGEDYTGDKAPFPVAMLALITTLSDALIKALPEQTAAEMIAAGLMMIDMDPAQVRDALTTNLNMIETAKADESNPH